MQRFFGGSKTDDDLCLTSFGECCREPEVIKNDGFGWKFVESLKKWSMGILALGSTFIALVLYHKNKNLQKRLGIIKEDWKYLKQERLRLKSELCRLKRSKAILDGEIRKTADMSQSFVDSFARERSKSDVTVEVERMKREVKRLQRELNQSCREKEMLSEKLQQMLRRSYLSSYQK